MDRVNGLQYVKDGDDEYWMGYMDCDDFPVWYESYTHQAQIGFRKKEGADVGDTKNGKGIRKLVGKAKELELKEWEPAQNVQENVL